MTVVVLGDANVDMEIRLPQPDIDRAHSNPDPRLLGGGSAANTAAALGRLGVECKFVGVVGSDSFGRHATESLAEAGVDVSGVENTRDSPTVTVITVVPVDGERLIYVWPPTGGAHAELSAKATTGALKSADWLHVSGICLRVSPARESILAAMKQSRAAGVPVSLDLNLRLENWGWDGGFREVVEEAVSYSDVIMGSAMDEVVPLAGVDDPTQAAAIVGGDGRLVIARLGAGGVVSWSPEGATSVPSFGVVVADTVGAGDAHNAGFIAARLSGAEVGEALRWGNAVAALTVSRHGARSTPSIAEVEALLAR
ncbi:MAG: sugar kinase [Actinomycetota bacterium]|nr:sugar kinase [Actinomycetota bacterium]